MALWGEKNGRCHSVIKSNPIAIQSKKQNNPLFLLDAIITKFQSINSSILVRVKEKGNIFIQIDDRNCIANISPLFDGTRTPLTSFFSMSVTISIAGKRASC